MKQKVKTGMIGTGKLAHNLAAALAGSDFVISQVISRSEEKAKAFAQRFSIPAAGSDPSKLDPGLDLLIIAANDNAVQQAAASLAAYAGKNTVAFHGSGSVPLSALDAFGERAGVLYFMQTFTLDQFADFSEVPVFVETRSASEALLERLAQFLSRRVHRLDSAGRQRLHMGAVFACNFPNLMWIFAERLLKPLDAGVDIHVYEHLVNANVENVFRLGPREALTGPALRGDHETVQKHLDMLKDQPELQEVYSLLSRLISGEAEKKD